MKNINILKRKRHVGINVVILELILTLYDVCFMQNIFIATFRPSHRLGDPKMSGGKQHMFTLWSFFVVEFCIIL